MPIQPPSTSSYNGDPQFKIPPRSDSQSSGVDFSNTPLIKPSFLQRIQAVIRSLFTPKPCRERRTPPKILRVRVISSPSSGMKKLSQIFRCFFPQTKEKDPSVKASNTRHVAFSDQTTVVTSSDTKEQRPHREKIDRENLPQKGLTPGHAYNLYLDTLQKKKDGNRTHFSEILQQKEGIDLDSIEEAFDTAVFEIISQSHIKTHKLNQALYIPETFRDVLGGFSELSPNLMRSQQERFLKTLDVEVISRLEIMHSQKLSKEEKEELKDPPNETWQLNKLQELEPQIRKIINSPECQRAVRTYLKNVIAAKEPTGQ